MAIFAKTFYFEVYNQSKEKYEPSVDNSIKVENMIMHKLFSNEPNYCQVILLIVLTDDIQQMKQ